ncbi:MAG: hypothetical protein GXP62_04050 [Oligoflexia bacterium]|nr:hypothetical protein [Oligoflexia bacterium]
MNVFELLAYTRRLLSAKGVQVWGGDAEMIEHLQRAYEKVYGRLSAMDLGFNLVKKDFTWTDPSSTSTETAFDLPPYVEAIKLVEFLDDAGKRLSYTAWPIDQVQAQYPGYIGFNGYVWWLRRNRLVIDTQWATGLSYPKTVRVWFYRAPSELVVFKPTSATVSSVVMPPEPYDEHGKILAVDGYYDGAVFEVVSGTGAGQTFEVESYDGSTRTLTLVSSLSTAPDSDSIISSVPAIPARAHGLIAYETALDGARIEENTNAASLLMDERRERWEDLERTLTTRQVQMPRFIVSLNEEDYY